MSITPLYAAFFGIVLVVLAWRINALRQASASRMTDHGHNQMTALTRAQAHLVEYTPLALILMLSLELDDFSPGVLHALGMALVIGRLLHLKGLNAPTGQSMLRKFATRLIWAQIIVAALLCFAHAFGVTY